MTYDDRPMYEQNKEKSKLSVIQPCYLYPTATYPSQTLSWHLQEDEKRRKGLANEIDEAEIRAAAKGVKNKWYDQYMKDPKRFKIIVEGKSYNWDEIKLLGNSE